MQIEKLFIKDNERLGPIRQLSKPILGFEVDIIGRVDGLSDAKYLMRSRSATTLFGFVLNVINPAAYQSGFFFGSPTIVTG